MIHQHFKLVDVFSAMDNIVLGTKGKRLGRKALREKIEALGQSFGLEIEPEKMVGVVLFCLISLTLICMSDRERL